MDHGYYEKRNFPARHCRRKEGLHGGFAFPILLRGEVFGVIEFFSREIQPPDAQLLNMMFTVGSQIGQFIEHRQVTVDLQASEQRYRTLADSMPQIVDG
jgi:GAF domain-containing protein